MILLLDNCWQYSELPVDVLCPPGGKRLKVSFESGDYVDLVYDVYNDVEAIGHDHPAVSSEQCGFLEVAFPVTVLSVKGTFGNGQLRLMPKELRLAGQEKKGSVILNESYAEECDTIMHLSLSGVGNVILQNSFYKNSAGPILQIRE